MKNSYFIPCFSSIVKKIGLAILFFVAFENLVYSQYIGKIPNNGKDSISVGTQESDISILSLNPQEYLGKELIIIPPSPTAASLGRYGDVPVTMYTGTPNINIPLFELESTKLSVPVSISYLATGVKVSEIPGWVGLGWSLDAGGVITRTVNNIIDEESGNGYIDYCQNIPTGFNSASCDFLNTIASSEDGFVDDAEPDIFSFNFHGITGKFVFGSDGEPKLIPFQKLEIRKQIGTIGLATGITGFTIKAPDGKKYEFGGNGAVEITRFEKPGPDPQPFFSSWYLTRIISSDFKDTIKFSYTGHTLKGDINTSHSMVHESFCGTNWSGGQLNSSVTLETISVQSLSMIESKKGKAIFNITNRTDCDGGKKLASIMLFSANEVNPYKSYTFSYTDVTSTPSATGYVGKRLFLDNINLRDSLGNNVGKYSFGYYNRENLPPRNSKAQDHWGFYNGANSNTTLIPAATQYGLSGANRLPNESFVKNGVLDKIMFPTGGYTEFVYEAHKNSSILLSGGLRIKEIHNNDGTITTKKKYTYGTGNLFSALPVYEYTIEIWNGIDQYCNSLFRQAYSQIFLGTSNGSYVGYANVTEWIGENGEGGKTERLFCHFNDEFYDTYPFSPGTSYDWARGKLLTEKHFRNNSGTYSLVEETIYNYHPLTGTDQNSYNVKGLRVGYAKIGIAPKPYTIPCKEHFSINRYHEYYYYSRWVNLREKTRKIYTTTGTFTENTKYYYTKPNHAQITKMSETTSTGDSICTFYYYPQDYNSSFQTLIDSFFISKPIDIRVYFNNQLISGNQFEYNMYGLPTTIRQAQLLSGNSIPFMSGTPYTFQTLINITYNQNFNIQEILPVNNYPTTYLWSYKDTYPVMKIENASFSQFNYSTVQLINELRNATEATVIANKLDQIRNNISTIPNTLITSFQYRRHLGITKVMDPTNVKTNYTYDKFGRLQLIKNDDNNLLNQYLYNYIHK